MVQINFPALTNAQVVSDSKGGGDLVYAENLLGREPIKDEKILLKLGQDSTKEEMQHSITNPDRELCGAWSVGFIDNNTCLSMSWYQGSNEARYSRYYFYNNEWSYEGTTADGYELVFPRKNGIYELRDNKGKSSFVYLTNQIRSVGYIGECKGKHYGYKDEYNNDICQIDITTGTTIGSVLLNASGSPSAGYVDDSGIGFLLNQDGRFDGFIINEDGTFSFNGSKSIPYSSANLCFIGCTGGQIGDYIFLATNSNNTYLCSEPNTNQKQESQAVVYKIIDNGSGGRTLQLVNIDFLNIRNCYYMYDQRNNTLTLGTPYDIRAYQFDREKDTFNEISLMLELPENSSHEYCYHFALSPDESKAIVTVVNSDGKTNKVALYLRSYTSRESIIEDNAYYYNPINCFTGFITGNIDDNGKYEVKTVLPNKEDVTVNITNSLDYYSNLKVVYGEVE